jgi:hypothetical protein
MHALGPPHTNTAPALCLVGQLDLLSQPQSECLALLTTVLQFISAPRRRARFAWWWRLICHHLLAVLYPSVESEVATPSSSQGAAAAAPAAPAAPLNAVAAAAAAAAAAASAALKEVEGFRCCPAPIQGLLIENLFAFHQQQLLGEVLLGAIDGGDGGLAEQRLAQIQSSVVAPPPQVRMILEMLNQAMALPILYGPTLERVIECYLEWTRGVNLPHLLAGTHAAATMAHYQRAFLTHTFSVWFVELRMLRPEELHAKLHLCARVTEYYRTLSQQPWGPPMTQATWERLLVTLLNACHYLIITDDNQNEQLQEQLIHPLLRTMFDAYVIVTNACPQLSQGMCSPVSGDWRPVSPMRPQLGNVGSSGSIVSEDQSAALPSATFVLHMWEMLCHRVQTCWMYWLPFVRQWKIKLIALTQTLLQQVWFMSQFNNLLGF